MINEFWITNISKLDISLRDLGLTVRAGRSINLLDKRHYNFSIEQLHLSAKDGSIFKKSKKVKVRTVAPLPEIPSGIQLANDYRPTLRSTNVEIVEVNYEELEISDEKFAAEFLESEEEES